MFKNKIKKYISALLIIVIVLGSFSMGIFAYGSDPVTINENNFPDKNFRMVVADWYDGIDGSEPDGYLSQNEIKDITLISIAGMLEDTCGEDSKITDLTGIEYFTSCKRLRCGGIGLTSLDVSKMPNLVELTCAGNELTSLDISKNINLEWLNCSSNELTTLDFSKNPKLTRIDCYINKLSDINVSMLGGLTTLRCQRNELTEIDLSKNTALTTLNCSNNHLTALDLTANTALKDVTASSIGNQTTYASARIDNGNYFVALPIKNHGRITSTSVDRIEDVGGVDTTVLGYDGYDFWAETVEKLFDGIDYHYNTGLAEAEEMSVHIEVARDFYQVSFYTDENMHTLLGKTIVNSGEAAQAPEITDIPQCKAFGGWSDDISSVNSDMKVYAVWLDAHNLEIKDFSNGIVTIECLNCDSENAEYVFAKLVNTRAGSKKYVKTIDVNSDGIINAKDYAWLLRTFKK